MVDSSRWTEVIEVLGCDIESRPAAPGPAGLQTYLAGVSRFLGALLYEFRLGARDILREFVAAERVCCSGFRWNIQDSTQLSLRISGSETQLDVIEGMFAPA